ncbi:transglycosylase domain-containing protein [Maritimibacter fusiformis]|uniref:peptidoglycan glycosyltransferase n=1 Tax=Maritimibacter fusiformis TaxID=2603819 RepID=A0A5D0RKP9_9RHOB|nr:PBP1A family penicillin-binding protein [Maritimibacter fusiformis]TYB82013.1 PBP1A family penicillin-binding protein [Maritimibacter fusiformis]
MAKNGSRRPPLVADKRYARPARKTAETRKPKRRSPRPPKPPRRRRHWLIALPLALVRWMWRVVFKLSLTAAVAAALLLGAGILYYTASMPPLDKLVDGRARGSVTLLDRNGEVFAWRGEQFGGLITVENVSEVLKNAVVATEDKRFYRHFGVSPRGIAGAIRINLSEGRGPLSGHGGSTITQQTAKLVCLGVPYDPASGMTEAEYEADCRESSLWRKVKEAVYAMALETRFSKDEILTIYLNRAFLGSGAYGFEAASQRYFGKPASEVDTSEAAVLAGALTAPTRYAPTNDLDRSWERALTVIKLMEEQGYLTAAEAERARNAPAELSEAAEARAGGYFADWMMNTGPSFLTRDTTEDVFIRTTFDQKIQKAAEEALAWVFENKVSPESKAQAAIVVMSSDGAVRAMVGGRKTQVTGAFNRATMAMRQTGSAFKPFVYAAALDLGWRYDSIIEDAPITIDIPGSGPWSPTNYTNDFRGWVTLTDALANSLNIPAVKLSEAVGRENVRTVAGMFGIESDLALGPALALGASESTLLEMTGAYAGILNGGSSVTPYGLVELRLLGDDAPLMEQEGGIGERVITPAAAEQLIYMMHQVMLRGSGQRANLPDREAAGKTGTTTAARDAWFLGFTADYVAGVWMGYDDNTPLKGTTGGGLPAEIWRETMVRVHKDLPPRPLPMIKPDAPPVVSEGTGGPNGWPGNDGGRVRSPAPAPDSLLGVLRTILGIDN